MALLQQDRLVSLATPLGKDVLLVESLEGTESVSALFRFQLALVSEKRDIALKDLVGQNVTLVIELVGKKMRYFNGFVSRFSQGDVDSRVSHYYLEVVPWLWFLTRTADCRIFQRKTVPDIIQQIFKDLGFTDFKLRLMEEEGIFYFFEHQNGKHTLILGNDPSVHQPCPNQAQARYGYMSGGVQDKDMITRLHIDQELQPGKVTLTDYYFQTPSNDLKVSAPSAVSVGGNGKFEIYDYPGYYAKRFDGDDKAGKVRPDGERTAKLGMQGEEASHKLLTGASSCRAFVPGYKFELIEHRRKDLNGPYVLTQVSHAATNNLGDGEGSTYDNTFTAIPAAVPVRPNRVTAKPLVHGTQTAVVVGMKGEEIDTDKYGRVKVQFHWDREGKKDQNSSCWIRVAQPWAGKGYGTAHIPRIGSEVVVAFLEGDPDQPLIIGSVYNAEQTVPYLLPANKMVQGIRSNSTPGGGGYNEIIVNDTKGKEKITVHGQYDMNTTVEHDQTTTVHNNRTDKIDVDDSETVGNNQKLTVGVNQDVKIGSNQTISVGAKQKVTVGSDQTIGVGAKQGLSVASDQTVAVGAARTVSVSAADKLTVGSNRTVSIGAAHKVGVSGAEEITVGGTQTISVSGAIKITSGASITLEVGGSCIKIGPGGIDIISSAPITITGAVVKVNS